MEFVTGRDLKQCFESGERFRTADIVGLEGIYRGRPLEIVPYAVARSDFQSQIDSDDPFTESNSQDFDGGVDLKYALNSSLTLTGTINPDFGQVEVDLDIVVREGVVLFGVEHLEQRR